MPDIPYQGASALPLWSPSPVVEWLLLEGWREGDTGMLLRGVGERLNAAGIPVWRMFCAVPSLHPQYFGLSYVWRSDMAEIEHRYGSWEMRDTPAYRNNPIRTITDEGGGAVRRRLLDPRTPMDFSVLEDLKVQGATDYVVLPMEFMRGRRAAVSFASRDPAGFTVEHLRQLNDLMPVLARIVESHMLRTVSANLLDTYVGRDAGMRILDGEIRRGATRSIFSAIWYSDLRGFTALTEALPSERVIVALNAYFEAMTTAVHGHRGEVLKFIGDGLLAIFPVEPGGTMAQACCRALSAAESAEEAMANVNEGRAAVGAPLLDYGLALHVGEVMYGNIGGADRLDFTVIGPAVNTTHRLEELCKRLERRPLLSRPFVEATAPHRRFESVGTFMLRGLAAEQEVFTPLRGA